MQNYNRRMFLNGMTITFAAYSLPFTKATAAPLATPDSKDAYEAWREREREIMFALACCCYRSDDFVERDRAILMQMLIEHEAHKEQAIA